MRKYALIPIADFNDEMLNNETYPANIEQSGFRMLEYSEQPDPIGEGWVIFSGEDANVKCAEYLNNLPPTEVKKLYFSTIEERDSFNAAEAEFAGADPSLPYLETGEDELGYYLLIDVIKKPSLWQRFKNWF